MATKPKITRETLHAAMLPPNNCQVKKFREGLDTESREVLDEALSYPKEDISAAGLRDWLVSLGFPEVDVPGVDAILSHRAGRRPCRCKG